MTQNERKVLEVLAAARRRGSDRQTPMSIGLKCGNPNVMASSWACRHLRHLRDEGLVKWSMPGEYSITEAGLVALEAK